MEKVTEERTEMECKSTDLCRGDNEEILIGILCYNHEPYVSCCLDSVFSQKCEFPFKVFVFDDVSTDGSWKVILEYKKKFGEQMIIFQPETNTFQQGHRNAFLKMLLKIRKAKYIALCEADDYWTDEYKLQKQLKELQKIDGLGICIHDVELYDVRNNRSIGIVPGRVGRQWTQQELVTRTLTYRVSFRANSYFFHRALLKDENIDSDFWDYWAGDIAIIIHCILNGSVIYLNENMAIKRINNEGSLSHKSNLEIDVCQQQIDLFQADLCWIKAFDQISKGRYNDLVEYYKLFRMIKLYYLEKGQLIQNRLVSNGNGKVYTRELQRKLNRFYINFVRTFCRDECKYIKVSRKWMEKEWGKLSSF